MAQSRGSVRGTSQGSLVVVALVSLSVLLMACGGGSDSAGTQPSSSAASDGAASAESPTSATASEATRSDLDRVRIQVTDLAAGWVDLGDQPASRDLANPPPSCVPSTSAVLTDPDLVVLHQFTYNPDGTVGAPELGSIASASFRARSTEAVEATINAVAQPGYATCAIETTKRFLQLPDTDTLDATATRLAMSLPVSAQRWRVIANLRGPAHEVFSLDIIFLANGRHLQKIRISRCGCLGAVSPGGELQPGVDAAIAATATRLAQL